MRILLVSFSTLPTMQKYLYYGYEELASLGLDAHTVGSESLKISFNIGRNNVVVPTPENSRPSLASLTQGITTLIKLSSAIKKLDPAVIHFVNKHSWNFVLLLLLRLRGVRATFVHTFHDPIGHHGDAVQKQVILYHRVMQRSLQAIVVHSSVAETQTQETLRPRCRVQRIPLGVTGWRDVPTSMDRYESRNVLFFGRLNNYKGCAFLPDFLERLERLAPEVTVTIAGKPSPDLDLSLLERIRERPNAVLHARFIDEEEAEDMFARSALLIAPYTSITQSGVLLDASSHALSVVAFDIEGIREYSSPSAIFVDPFDVDAFAATVAREIATPESCRRRGVDSWTHGRDNFGPAAMAAELGRLYSELGSKHPARKLK